MSTCQCCCSVAQWCPALWTAARQASLSFTLSHSLLKLTSIESVMPPNHLILCHPLLLPSISPSIRGFSSESALCIRWPKYWSSSFSITPSNEYSGLLSFRMDLFSLLSKLVLWTLKCDFHIIWRGGWRPYLEECGILRPRPGIKPAPPALGEQSLNHWTARKSPHIIFMCYKL